MEGFTVFNSAFLGTDGSPNVHCFLSSFLLEQTKSSHAVYQTGVLSGSFAGKEVWKEEPSAQIEHCHSRSIGTDDDDSWSGVAESLARGSHWSCINRNVGRTHKEQSPMQAEAQKLWWGRVRTGSTRHEASRSQLIPVGFINEDYITWSEFSGWRPFHLPSFQRIINSVGNGSVNFFVAFILHFCYR